MCIPEVHLSTAIEICRGRKTKWITSVDKYAVLKVRDVVRLKRGLSLYTGAQYRRRL